MQYKTLFSDYTQNWLWYDMVLQEIDTKYLSWDYII